MDGSRFMGWNYWITSSKPVVKISGGIQERDSSLWTYNREAKLNVYFIVKNGAVLTQFSKKNSASCALHNTFLKDLDIFVF